MSKLLKVKKCYKTPKGQILVTCQFNLGEMIENGLIPDDVIEDAMIQCISFHTEQFVEMDDDEWDESEFEGSDGSEGEIELITDEVDEELDNLDDDLTDIDKELDDLDNYD